MAPRRGKGTHRYGVGTHDVVHDGKQQRYRWRYSTTTATGAKKVVNIKKTKLEDLDAAVDQFLVQERELGYALDPDRRTVLQYCNTWLEHVVKVRNENSTVVKYRYDLQRLMPYIGNVRLRTLQPSHIQAAIKALTERKNSDETPYYKATTIIRSVEVLRNALGDLPRGTLPYNPAETEYISLPKADEYHPLILSPDELLCLLEGARGLWLEVAFHTYALTGLRRGEVLGLTWANINFERQVITPMQQVKYVGNKVEVGRLKTDASRKPIPMPQALVPWLHEQRRRVLEYRVAHADTWKVKDCDLVFPSTVGTPISPRNLLRAFKQLLEDVGLPTTFTIHGFRHSYGTLLGRTPGLNAKDVQAMLRHADVRTTYRYMHSDEERQRMAAEVMGRLLDVPQEERDAR